MIGDSFVRHIATGFFTLAFFAVATSASFADQTVTVTIPLNLTNLPPQIARVGAVCYAFAPPVSATMLAGMGNNTVGGAPPPPLAVGNAQMVTLAGPTYSGNLTAALKLSDASLIGITQGLPYYCWVNFYPPNSTTAVNPTQFFVLPPSTYTVYVSGTLPIAPANFKP